MAKRYRTKKQEAVESEFEESFWDVVRGFADQGHTRNDTAAILGWNTSAFWRLLKRQAPSDIVWPKQKDSVANKQRWNCEWE